MHLKILVLALLVGSATTTLCRAQSRGSDAIGRFERQTVHLFETALSQHTEKTVSIIYLRRIAGSTRTGRFCGEAFFGSHRDRFVIDMSENVVLVPPSDRAWTVAGCNDTPPDAHTFIDLR